MLMSVPERPALRGALDQTQFHLFRGSSCTCFSRRVSSGVRQRAYAGQYFRHGVAGALGVVLSLQVKSPAIRKTEVSAQAQIGIRRHGAFSLHDLVDAAR